MSFWTRLFGRKSITSSLDLFREIYGGGRESRAGVTVNWQTALDVPTVLDCVRIISNGIAQVPWRVYQDEGAGKRVATEHVLHPLLRRRPNEWQTSFELRETVMFHLILTGNAYVWVGRVGRERAVRALEPIEPHRVTVKRDASGKLTYRVTADDGATVDFDRSAIWHLRGPSWNSWLGLEAVKLAREAIGLSIATERAHADFHQGGARISGLLAMKDTIGPEKFTFLSAWLDRHSEGGDRAGKPIVLDNGATYTPFNMTGVDAQHLETRKFQIEEICRAFGVLPIMVGHAGDQSPTYASAEQMFLAHVVYTLGPWYERIEQSADVALLSDEEQASGYYTKFSPNGLMRGAAKDRAEFYTKALGAGGHGTAWMTPNEVRALEEMDPISGGESLPVGTPPAASEDSDG